MMPYKVFLLLFLPTLNIRGTPALRLNEPAVWSCSVAGLGLVWYRYCIYLMFVCLIQKKWICFGFLRGFGCVGSKNKANCKRKSTKSSLNPSIIQFGSFKCRAGVPLTFGNFYVFLVAFGLFVFWGVTFRTLSHHKTQINQEKQKKHKNCRR